MFSFADYPGMMKVRGKNSLPSYAEIKLQKLQHHINAISSRRFLNGFCTREDAARVCMRKGPQKSSRAASTAEDTGEGTGAAAWGHRYVVAWCPALTKMHKLLCPKATFP